MPLFLQRLSALILLCILSPLFGLISLIIILFEGMPVFFWQKRRGKGNRPFWMCKFRTMVVGSEKQQPQLTALNEADGPVFKIRNDPRFTSVGKWLSWSGLDELPQLFNILKGEMAFVGPRPLPVLEAIQVSKRYWLRFTVAPGLTSLWVAKGAHKLSFKEWMELDLYYVQKRGFFFDVFVIALTVLSLTRSFILFVWSRGGSRHFSFYSYLLGVIGALGAFFRYSHMTTKIVWNDEVYYFLVSRNTSLVDLVTTNHWIVDHPPLYLIFMHFWTMVSTDPLWLRIPNLVIYCVSIFLIYRIGELFFKNKFFTISLCSIYALFPYFIHMDWQAIPYAIAFSFFLLSFYAYILLFRKEYSKYSVLFCALSLALFFHTSFEAVYYLGSLLCIGLYLFFIGNVQMRPRLAKLFWITLLLILPETLLVFSKLNSFPDLNQQWLSWRWDLMMLLRDVFGVGSLPLFCAMTIAPVTYLLFFAVRENGIREKLIFTGTLLLFFGLCIVLVSHLFFYVSHPKAYYYAIFIAWLFLLLVLDWSLISRPRITLAVIVLMITSSFFWFTPRFNWLQADYLYTPVSPSGYPYQVRGALLNVLSSDPESVLVTDLELQKHDWRMAVYLNSYYLDCYDLDSRMGCWPISRARRSVVELSSGFSGQLIGVIMDLRSIHYFTHTLCSQAKRCLIWDWKENTFLEVKED